MRMPRFLSHRARYWVYLLVLTPAVTDWIEIGGPPTTPRSYLTELVVGALIAVCLLVIQRKQARLEEMATTDALTGLYNRHRFVDDLEREVAMAHRLQSHLCLVYVDVDGFKQVNDVHGHAEGDQVLCEVAQLLSDCARREVDAAYRVGGDEFALLLPGVDAEQCAQMSEALAHCPADRYPTLARHAIRLSVGGADLTDAETADGLIGRADNSMYAHKHANRGHRAKRGAEHKDDTP